MDAAFLKVWQEMKAFLKYKEAEYEEIERKYIEFIDKTNLTCN